MTDDVMARVGGRDVVEQLRSSGALDGLFERIDSGGAGDHWDRWPAPRFAQRVALERGLAAELTDHLGYERGESAPSARPNTRNGTTAKTVDSEVGPFEIEVPRDRAGSFTPRLVRKGQRRPGRPGFDDHQLVRRGHDGARYPPPPGVHDRCGPERGNDPRRSPTRCATPSCNGSAGLWRRSTP